MSIQFNEENFEKEVLQSDVPVLVDFFATWCGPCKMMGPVVEQLSEELTGSVKVGKLDIDQAPSIAQKYNVMSVPTFLVMKEGKVADTVVGAVSKDVLKAKIQ